MCDSRITELKQVIDQLADALKDALAYVPEEPDSKISIYVRNKAKLAIRKAAETR